MAAAGEVIGGRYRLVRPFASGHMSRIWLATDEETDTFVVVKHCAIPEGLTLGQQELVRDWALPEAIAASRVEHPNVIRTLDVLPSWDGPWVVMEYLPSRSLLQVIEETGPLPPVKVARIGLALVSALRAAGRAGVLHLDVKPGNVLLTEDGRVVLTDFGPTVTPNGIRTLADAGIVLGSPKYIAPERIFDHATDERSDLWSVGVTLYHAVEGRPPFLRPTTAEVLRAVGAARPEPPRRAGALTPVLAGLLRREPSERMGATGAEWALRGVIEAGRRRPRSAARRRIPAIIAAVAVTTTLTAVAATAQGGTFTRTGETAPARASAVSTSGQPEIALPNGYTWWTGAEGYRVAVPAGWRRDEAAAGLAFRATRDRALLGITPLPQSPSDVVAELEIAETETHLPGYHRVRLEALPDPSAAIWEYTFQDPDGTAMRSLRRVTTAGGRTYVIEWQSTRDAWTAQLPRFTVVLASFTPRP
ncbi:serine/threonine-protein kinase [Actinoplanes subglobosus]|uniref:Serine/threonine-protein kinase n=1 Tax=Actinoplanes subglobosus TaxID=1547892 RepID=A0ABV8IND1_9ACTN